MLKRSLALVLLLAGTGSCKGCQKDEVPEVVVEAGSTSDAGSSAKLTAFRSEKEIVDYLNSRQQAVASRREKSAAKAESAPSPAPAAAEPSDQASAEGESVTNVQHAGVDEGGIVKVHGDHLVVLRRGRLFTVNVGDGALTPVSSIDAFGPDVDPSGSWYDEMLIAGDTIVVVGYSYRRGGTEIGLFDIDRDGKLAYRATHHLRSNDYYSSRNYASRLLGKKLVFYTPLYLSHRGKDPLARFPAVRKWKKDATDADFRRIAEPKRIYRPLTDSPTLALHTVTVCDLEKPELDCTATAVMGPPGRVFYVSPTSVYVWMTEWAARSKQPSAARSLVYRMPLDGGDPTALRAFGSPIDQFSFLESGDRHLNVMLRADAAGEGMWGAEITAGDVALMRVPVDAFTGDARQVESSRYARLPKPEGYAIQNRFVGDWLLYGSGTTWGRPKPGTDSTLVAYRWSGGSEPVSIGMAHGVDRIEVLGKHAIVVGTSGQDLHFTPIALAADRASRVPSYTRRNAAQGELRSHGFFYKPETDTSGMLGLPIRAGGSPGYSHLSQGSASVLFLKNESLHLTELGDLESRSNNVADGCRASCVDWYGNARPLFLRGRVFALLGYEIVEGELAPGSIRERRRVSFAPSALAIAR